MRPRGRVRRAAGAVGVVASLAACTVVADPPGRAALSPTVSGSTAASVPHRPGTTEPLVLIAHHSRGELRVPAAVVRGVGSGRISHWTPLDGSGDRLRVVGSAAAVAADRRAVALLPASRVGPGVRAAVVGAVDPLRRPAAYALRTAGPSPPDPVTLTVVGDVMLGRGVAAAAGDRSPVAALRPMRRLLGGADVTVANLESTLSTDGEPRQGSDSFAADPAVLPGMARLGIDAVSLANNHTGDYGRRALLETLAAFGGSGLARFGAGRDLMTAARPLVVARDDTTFGFVAFNAIGETPRATPTRPGALSLRMPPRTGPLSRPDLARVLGIVKRLDRRVDVVVVLPHWGAQYTHDPEPVQAFVGRRLVAAGADLVVGGHPHWVQGLELVGGAVVAHSLGNFVFDMDFMEQTMEGIALTATFWDGRLKAVHLTPYRLDGRFAPRPVPPGVGAAILADVWSHSTGPFRSAGP